MKTIVILFLCATVTSRAFAAPAEESPEVDVPLQEVKEEPAPDTNFEEELNQQETQVVAEEHVPEVASQLCFSGWEYYKGSCYHLNNAAMTWAAAVEYCASYEATLAAVHSRLQFNHLKHMAGTAAHQLFWSGGFHFEGSWRWQDGSPFDLNLLESSSTTYTCIIMSSHTNRGWYSSGCYYKYPSICQIKADC